MTHSSDALWLNVSPSLKGFDRPLLDHLSQSATLTQWDYQQTLDEPVSLETALTLLHDALKSRSQPVHLLGHGSSGLLGLLYAQQHPERVRSLTLLSVGVHPTVNWHSHYYTQRRLLDCDQKTVLRQIAYRLLGCPPKSTVESFIQVLEQDLYHSLSPHSLFRSMGLLPISVPVPLFVCGSVDDEIIEASQLRAWQSHFEHFDSRLWVCPAGRHFFHYFYPEQVSEQIVAFWNAASVSPSSHENRVLMNQHPTAINLNS